MIGTSDGKQYNSELDYLMGNEQVAQSDSAGPVTKNKDPAPSGYESMRPSTNVEDARNESGFDKFTQQMKDQLSRFQEDPMKFIMHGQAGWHNAQPMLTQQGQDYDESAGRMIQHNQTQPSFDDPSQNAPVSPLQPRTAVIIRHGDTSYTEADKAHGWSQEPLTDKGAEEVWKYADLKDKPDMLVTSDLPRTAETAAIVSEKTGVPVAEQHQGLRTWDIGDLQGKPCPEADKELEKYVGNPDKPVPGGESFNDFKSRVLGSFKDVLDRYPDQKVGFVTHSKVQKLLDAYDSTGGQYVDHDEYLTKPEAPGKEKTMQLAMNDNFGISSHPVLNPDVLSNQLQGTGMSMGAARFMPHANENIPVSQRLDKFFQEHNPGQKLTEGQRQTLDEYETKYGRDPMQIEQGEPDTSTGPFEGNKYSQEEIARALERGRKNDQRKDVNVGIDSRYGIPFINPKDSDRFLKAMRSTE